MRSTAITFLFCLSACATGLTSELSALDTSGFQNNQSRDLNCTDQHNHGDQSRTCEVREQTIPVSGAITVDASPNGGVSVKGWNQNQILVRAKVEAWADSESEAQSIAREVNQNTSAGEIRSTGPSSHDHSGWSVSYEVFVPHLIDVTAQTVNGGVALADIGGKIRVNTTNGGLHLARLSGDVEGKTTNGGVNVALMGDHWDGTGLDVSSNNGGVNVSVPSGYSAHLQGSTVNGGLASSFGGTAQVGLARGRNQTIDTVVGRGGAPVKVSTVNGGLSFSQS